MRQRARNIAVKVIAAFFALCLLAPLPSVTGTGGCCIASAQAAPAKSVKKRQTTSSSKERKASRANKQKRARAPAMSNEEWRASRYAAYVINADTGEVLHSVNATASRYPASLTKMMTLYLTFDSLKKGKLKLNQRLPVSLHAASQPQTNIALGPDDTLRVEDAIEALVVRSANDAAVVLAEAQGGTEEGFARLMTAKAQALGMNNTVFRNASGLPNSEQHSCARDLAILGVALRRHFPEYYPYFDTREFTFQGRTYTTHNRVMLRYPGADGIKTGFINASGFNLVTSAKKDGYRIVGVVMGGSSAQARDNEMISLLDSGFTLLAGKSGNKNSRLARMQPEEKEPVADSRAQGDTQDAAQRDTPQRTAAARADASTNAAADTDADEEETAAAQAPQAPAPAQATAKTASAATAAPPAAPAPSASSSGTPSPSSGTVTQAPPVPAVSTDPQSAWAIQLGAFADEKQAKEAAQKALQLAAAELSTPSAAISAAAAGPGLHRARIVHLSRTQAESACRKLLAASSDCFVTRAGS